MPDIISREEQTLDLKEMQELLECYGKLDKGKRDLLIATVQGMALSVEAERRSKERSN